MSVLRTLAKQCLWKSGGYALVAAARSWHGVAVLAYHGVRDARSTASGTSEELHVRRTTLERQLRAVRALASPISLEQWRRARQGGPALPDRSVLVTFDDGYRSVLQPALPVLERYEVPAVVFVCTGPAQRGELLWYDAMERRGRASEIERAKRLSYARWRVLLDEVRKPAEESDERAVMTPGEVGSLAKHQLVEIGAHSVDHPVLSQLSVDAQRRQIVDSIDTLRDWTAKPIRAFAYPNGQRGDFTDDTIRMVQECGIDAAFSTEPRIAACDDPMRGCPRFTMMDAISDAHLAQYLSLSWPRAIA